MIHICKFLFLILVKWPRSKRERKQERIYYLLIIVQMPPAPTTSSLLFPLQKQKNTVLEGLSQELNFFQVSHASCSDISMVHMYRKVESKVEPELEPGT